MALDCDPIDQRRRELARARHRPVARTQYITDNKGEPVPVDMEARWDSNADGMQWQVKLNRFPEIFRDALGSFNPNDFSNMRAPLEVEAAFREVFGEYATRDGKVRLMMHPWFPRWCLAERLFDQKGDPNGWKVFWICSEKPEATLPQDMQTSDHRYDNMAGYMGAFKMPTKKDFELVVYYADRHRASQKEIIERQREGWAAERRAAECTHEAALHDFHSYVFQDISTRINREHGTGWNPWSYATLEHKANHNFEREVVKTANGQYTRVRRKGNERHEAEVAEERKKLQTVKGLAEMSAEELNAWAEKHAKEIAAGAEEDDRRTRARQAQLGELGVRGPRRL